MLDGYSHIYAEYTPQGLLVTQRKYKSALIFAFWAFVIYSLTYLQFKVLKAEPARGVFETSLSIFMTGCLTAFFLFRASYRRLIQRRQYEINADFVSHTATGINGGDSWKEPFETYIGVYVGCKKVNTFFPRARPKDAISEMVPESRNTSVYLAELWHDEPSRRVSLCISFNEFEARRQAFLFARRLKLPILETGPDGVIPLRPSAPTPPIRKPKAKGEVYLYARRSQQPESSTNPYETVSTVAVDSIHPPITEKESCHSIHLQIPRANDIALKIKKAGTIFFLFFTTFIGLSVTPRIRFSSDVEMYLTYLSMSLPALLFGGYYWDLLYDRSVLEIQGSDLVIYTRNFLDWRRPEATIPLHSIHFVRQEDWKSPQPGGIAIVAGERIHRLGRDLEESTFKEVQAFLQPYIQQAKEEVKEGS